MKELNMQQATDELRTLNEAEIEAVSGAKTIDMGYFGKLRLFRGGGSWTMESGDGDFVTITTCSEI